MSTTEPPNAGAVEQSRRQRTFDVALRLSVFILFIAMVALFSALRPSDFPTGSNLEAILSSAATIAVLGCGLTFVLVNDEFDLSFDNNTTLSGAVAVVAMANLHLGTGLGIALGIGAGAAVGLVNGVLVAYMRAPAFVATLAVGSMALGASRALTNDQTIYHNIPASYANFADASPLGIPMTIWLSVALVVVTWIALEYTVLGRRSYAVGGNETAARLAGVRTARVRLVAFGVLGGCAGLAGVIITSQSASFFPELGTGVLLPAYAAAFLGRSATASKQVRSWATYFGVVFISALQTGLQMVQLPPWTLDFFQGLVLAVAVVVASRRSA